MRRTTIAFTEYLEKQGYKYDTIDGGDGSDVVITDWSSPKMHSINVKMFLGDNDVAAKVFSIATVPDDKRSAVLEKINELHNRWRWVSLYIDEDNEITAQIDGAFFEETAAEICDSILTRIIRITDDCYPEFMKVLW